LHGDEFGFSIIEILLVMETAGLGKWNDTGFGFKENKG
jgi:hypothetical protein